MGNSNRLREALSKLELLVTLDIYPNETGSIGHFMLPCTSPLERPDLPFIFPMMLGLQTRPYLQATDAVLIPDGEQRDEASIYLDLCKSSRVKLYDSRIAQLFLEIIMKTNTVWNRRQLPEIPQKLLLNLILRLCGKMSFKKLLKHKHGFKLDTHMPGSFIPDRVYTEDKKIDLAPYQMLQAAKVLEDHFKSELNDLNQFKLISQRHVTTHNSWTHNIEEFVEGDRYTNYAYLHPSDAQLLDVEFKQIIQISTPAGSIRLPIKISNDIQTGTIAVPHGWGHQSSNLDVASKISGANVNILVKDGIENIEKVSGMSHLTGLTVSVVKCEELDAESWSGMIEDKYEVPGIQQS
jgi:formate dehydrogenase